MSDKLYLIRLIKDILTAAPVAGAQVAKSSTSIVLKHKIL